VPQSQQIYAVADSVVIPRVAVNVDIPSEGLNCSISHTVRDDYARDNVAPITPAFGSQPPFDIDQVNEELIEHHSNIFYDFSPNQ
jgi:hypothetical protein